MNELTLDQFGFVNGGVCSWKGAAQAAVGGAVAGAVAGAMTTGGLTSLPAAGVGAVGATAGYGAICWW